MTRLSLKIFSLLFVLSTSLLATTAHAKPAPDIYISESKTSLGADALILRGSPTQLNAEAIPELYASDAFHISNNHTPSLGITDDVVWVALPIKLISSKSGKFYLELGYSQLDSVTLYQLTENSLEHLHSTGDTYFFNQRPIIHRHFIFPIDLADSQTNTFFLRIETTGSMQFPINLWTQRAFWDHDQGRLFLQAIYLGIILVMVIYNLFLFVSTRERVYLYYILSISSIAAMLLTLTGMGFQMIWPDAPAFNNLATPLFITLATIFSARFADDFLSLPIQLPWASRILRFIAFAGLINLFIIPWAPYTFNIRQCGVVSVFCLVMNLTAGSICFQKGDRSAGYYMLAWSTFLIGGLSVALNKFGIISKAPASEYALQVGSALEVILLSFALGYRMNLLEEQNHEANRQRTMLRKEMTSHLQSRLHIFSRVTSELNKPLGEMHRLLRLLSENMVGASSVVDFLFPGSIGDDNKTKIDLERSVEERRSHLKTLDESFKNVSLVVRELQGMGVVGGRLNEKISLQHLIKNALERVKNEHGVRNYQKISLKIDNSNLDDIGHTFGNPYIIGHATSAIILNAFTYCLDSLNPSVLIVVTEGAQTRTITVKNNGPAIPLDTVSTLFDHSRSVTGNQATSLPVLRTVLQQQGANVRLLDSGNQSGWVQFEIILPKNKAIRPQSERTVA
ncbi:MAG: sensor histidine kinase [Deltaproteobacteria bacterium]|jgi:signal transduction histidine kinase|nr:sensor histidine kinase [Deltaproteobacteria bacterium]MBT6433175.1 sensor histidine kinase [Deltaproteobacteria bacterium]